MKSLNVFKLRVILIYFTPILITLLSNCSGNNFSRSLKDEDLELYCYDSLEQLDSGAIVVFQSRTYNNIISKMDTTNIKYCLLRNQKHLGVYSDDDIKFSLDSVDYTLIDTTLILNHYVYTKMCCDFINTTKTIGDTLDVNLLVVFEARVTNVDDYFDCSFISSCPPDIVKSQLKINLKAYNKIKHVIFRVAKRKRALINL